MSLYELLPLIIILLLQFAYQFQKAAKRRIAQKKRMNPPLDVGSFNEPPQKNEETSFYPTKEEEGSLRELDQKMREKYAVPIYQEFFQPSSLENDNVVESDFGQEEVSSEKKNSEVGAQEEALVDEMSYEDSGVAELANDVDKPLKRVRLKKSIINDLQQSPRKAVILNEILNKAKF